MFYPKIRHFKKTTLYDSKLSPLPTPLLLPREFNNITDPGSQDETWKQIVAEASKTSNNGFIPNLVEGGQERLLITKSSTNLSGQISTIQTSEWDDVSQLKAPLYHLESDLV